MRPRDINYPPFCWLSATRRGSMMYFPPDNMTGKTLSFACVSNRRISFASYYLYIYTRIRESLVSGIDDGKEYTYMYRTKQWNCGNLFRVSSRCNPFDPLDIFEKASDPTLKREIFDQTCCRSVRINLNKIEFENRYSK